MKEFQLKAIVSEFCNENHLDVKLSSIMPDGYEDAFGTYDVTINTLFLNTDRLSDAPEYEVLFYLLHELRHAMQYLHPEMFDMEIQESRFYVILYNGICYKLVDRNWIPCKLKGSESDFTDAYMSLPYEIDANNFAYQRVKQICGDSADLQGLYEAWTPKVIWKYEEYDKLFRKIDREVSGSTI